MVMQYKVNVGIVQNDLFDALLDNFQFVCFPVTKCQIPSHTTQSDQKNIFKWSKYLNIHFSNCFTIKIDLPLFDTICNEGR